MRCDDTRHTRTYNHTSRAVQRALIVIVILICVRVSKEKRSTSEKKL